MTTGIATIRRDLGHAAARARDALETALSQSAATEQRDDDAAGGAGAASFEAVAKATALLAAGVAADDDAGPGPIETEIVVLEWPTPSGETPEEISGVAGVTNGAATATSSGAISLQDDAIIGGTEAVLVLEATVEPDAATATGALSLALGDDVLVEATTSAAVGGEGGRASVSVSVTATDAAVVLVSASAGSDAFGAAAEFVIDLF